MTRNELEILQGMCTRWFDKLMKFSCPSEAYVALQVIKDFDEVIKELEKGVPEEN